MDESQRGDAPKKRPKRPRINLKEKMTGAEKVNDELEFTPCLGSKNARQIRTIDERISLELWYKHYIIERNQHKDDDGNQRDVPPEAVEALVTKSLKHLIFIAQL